MLDVTHCRTPGDYFSLVDLNNPRFQHRWSLEHALASLHAHTERFSVPGYCQVCERPVDFAVERVAPWTAPDGTVIPNWRESVTCPVCRMNARQRMVAAVLRGTCPDVLSRATTPGQPATAYIMEQRTPLYRWFAHAFGPLTVIGSEYSPDASDGSNEVRHEDAEHLTLGDDSVDLVISCDVLEHLDRPVVALRELARVLRPGGRALLTFPMDPHLSVTTRRARRRGSDVEYLLPPMHHLDPCSRDGILVYNDFGWDILDEMRSAGLRNPELHVYWSDRYGYLGIQFYFTAEKR